MADGSTGGAAQKLASMRQAQHRIRAQIMAVREQLERARKHPGGGLYWITLSRSVRVQDLRSRFRSLSEALEHDLAELRAQLKELRLERVALERGVARQPMLKEKAAFDARLQAILKEAEEQGVIEPGELEELRDAAGSVLQDLVDLVKADPLDDANVHDLLDWTARDMALGFTDQCPEHVMTTLRGAAETRRAKAESDFRRTPTVAALARVLEEEAFYQMAGGQGDLFSRPRPTGMPTVRPGTVHVVERGDTLAKISIRYYKTAKYWDQIYLHNHDVVGKDPERVAIGARLRMP